MYTLYYSPGSCALVIHCLLEARWGRWLEPKVTRMPNIEPFMKRMGERPAVGRAMAREGITPFS